MQLTAISLASGSSGNALLLRCGSEALLIDCGLTQRALERHLARMGLAPTSLQAIVITHEHGDHIGCAGPFARRYRVPVVVNRLTAAAVRSELAGAELIDLPAGIEVTLGRFAVRSFPVSHDAADPVGVVVTAGGACVAIATDLGCWDARVAAALTNGDLVVLEANHDRERLRRSFYAADLKNRIAGERGHLDNIEAGRLLAQIGADGRQRTAWLAHLSQEANSPEIALRMVRGVLAMTSVTSIDVHALPRRATLVWTSDGRAEQLRLL